MESAGTLAFVMHQRFGDGLYPVSLSVGSTAPERILLPDGNGVAAVPDGTRLLYSVAPDRSAWSVTLVGAEYGTVATYSSDVGVVSAE